MAFGEGEAFPLLVQRVPREAGRNEIIKQPEQLMPGNACQEDVSDVWWGVIEYLTIFDVVLDAVQLTDTGIAEGFGPSLHRAKYRCTQPRHGCLVLFCCSRLTLPAAWNVFDRFKLR